MKSQIFNGKFNSYHFIGVGGVSMSALATYLFVNKKEISGSDLIENEGFLKLKRLGAKVYIGHDAESAKKADAIIYSSAISDEDVELKCARESGKPIIKRSALLGEIMSEYKQSIGVAGSHGKTTTTAMISRAIIESGILPTVFLGGEDKTFGNFLLGESNVCVAEVCEYKKNLLSITPKIAVVLNIDNDHLDSYVSMGDMLDAFSEYASHGIAVVNADDKYLKSFNHSSAVTFGVDNLATYSASNICEKDGKYSFMAKAYGRKLGKIKLNIRGKHNVYNALATIAVCDLMKIPFAVACRAIEKFDGVCRRMETVGSVGQTEVVCDYAHHPSEISATLSAYPRNDLQYTIFQPHTYSRTKFLMNEFCESLFNVKNLAILKTYPAREKYDEQGDAKKLFEKLVLMGKDDCVYLSTEKEVKEYVVRFRKNKGVALVLGAGDVYDVIKQVIKDCDR